MDAVKLLSSLLGSNATGGNLLGSILKSATGGQQTQVPQSGGTGGLLGSLLGGGSQKQGSGGAGMLGSLLTAAVASQMSGGKGGGGIGDLLGGLFGGGSQPEADVAQPEPQQANDQALIFIQAMCNAAKSDGEIDQTEQQKIIGRLGELDKNEIQYLQQELSSPLDLNRFVSSVPRELAPQVYALSVMTVKVDTPQEAQYLKQLAQGLHLDQQTLDAVHQQAGLA